MACYYPVKALLSRGSNGKNVLSFNSQAVGKGISLPCGRCIGCRLERSRQWSVRIMHEAKMHDQNIFLTLTYSAENLPKDGSLVLSHLQKFLKRLRGRIEPVRIRFFACGEYGERMGRPHYHAILFGWRPSDGVLIKGSGVLSLWTSSLLCETWGLGFVSFGSVTFDSACYVANYATKKVTGDKAKSHYNGKLPEFLVMSRRPGIGKSWFDRFSSDVYPSDEVIVKGVSCRPPRYYDQLKARLDKVYMDQLKLRRVLEASKLEDMVLSSGVVVSVSPDRNSRRLQVREIVAKAKLSIKNRSLEKS